MRPSQARVSDCDRVATTDPTTARPVVRYLSMLCAAQASALRRPVSVGRPLPAGASGWGTSSEILLGSLGGQSLSRLVYTFSTPSQLRALAYCTAQEIE